MPATASFSNQKLVQNYLKKHDITQLFEAMMAKVIKEMPVDPVSYLIQILQKLDQQRNEGSRKGLISKTNIGLVGSAVPKKSSQDPQVVIPGSKPIVSHWATGNEEKVKPSTANPYSKRSKNYPKPWLFGTKSKRGEHQSESPSSWAGDVHSQTLDEAEISYFKEQKSKNKMLQSAPTSSLKNILTPSRNKGKMWMDSNKEHSKENTVPTLQTFSSQASDELDVESLSSPKSARTFSPATYAKFKKHSSKKKSLEQKSKLQRLLSSEKKNQERSFGEEDSSNDEGIEIIENTSELAEEGARTKISSGVVKQYQRKEMSVSSSVNISMCSNCARSIHAQPSPNHDTRSETDTEAFFKPASSMRNHQYAFSTDVQTDDDDFESISQVNVNIPFKPKWPVLDLTEGEETEDVTRSVDDNKFKKKKKVSLPQHYETDKSDFFTTNSPSRKKNNRHFSLNAESGNESVATLPMNKSLSKSNRQAWKQHTVNDTESEADDNILDLQSSMRRGWSQKQYDDLSD